MARATRRDAVMSMRMNPPSLFPPARTKTYIDYESLTQADINKCNRMIEQFKRTGKIECPTSTMYFKLMVVLREQRRLASLKGDFNTANEIDQLIREISAFFYESDLYKGKAKEVSTYEYQYNQAQTRLVDLMETWNEKLDRMRNQSQKATRRMDDFVQTQLSNYDTKIPSELPAMYSKLSPDLLNLKDRERHMIGCRMFKEAEELHKEFERRQKIELQRKREEYYRSFEINRKALEKRVNRKREAVLSDWNRKIQHAEHMMNKEINPLKEGCGNYERKLIAAKAEYIGENDPILVNEKGFFSPTYRVSPPIQTRGLVPRSMKHSTRLIQQPSEVTTTKKLSDTMIKQNRPYKVGRWP